MRKFFHPNVILCLVLIFAFFRIASAQTYIDTASKNIVFGINDANANLEVNKNWQKSSGDKYLGAFNFNLDWVNLDGPAGVGTRSSRRGCNLKLFSDNLGKIFGDGSCSYNPGFCGPLNTSVTAQVLVNSGTAILQTTNTSGEKKCTDPTSGWYATTPAGAVNKYQFNIAGSDISLEQGFCYLRVNGVCIPPSSFSNTFFPPCKKSNAAAGESLSDCDYKPYFGLSTDDPVYNANLSYLLAQASIDAYSNTQLNWASLPQAGFDVPVMVNDTTVPGTMTALVTEKLAAIDGESKRVLIIAFRGTQELPGDAITDADAKMVPFSSTDSSIKVHRGFKRATDAFIAKESSTTMRTSGLSLTRILQNAKADGTQIILTGHSLGGAMATIYGASLVDRQLVNRENLQIYTYGAPSVGNSNFVYSFFDGDRARRLNLFRVRNQRDPVTYVASLSYLYKYFASEIDAAAASNWMNLSSNLIINFGNLELLVGKMVSATSEMIFREMFELRPMQHLGFEVVFLESNGAYSDVTYSFDELSAFNAAELKTGAHASTKYLGFAKTKLGDPTTAFSARLLSSSGGVLSNTNVDVGMRVREADVGVPLKFYAALINERGFSSISGFNQITPSFIMPFAEKTLTTSSARLNLLGEFNLTTYSGSVLLVGYGRDYDEMIRKKTYRYLSLVN